MISTWHDLDPVTDSILLGNGFSRGVSETFAYDHLIGRAGLKPRLRAILDQCGSADFEHGMLSIEHTLDVLGGLEDYARHAGDTELEQAIRTLDIATMRRDLQDALIRAVHTSHPDLGSIPPEKKKTIGAHLATYREVFTTNYDLLPYWFLIAVEGRSLEDFFRRDVETGALLFDRAWAEALVASGAEETRTALYHLHGALHLRERADHAWTEKIHADRDTRTRLLTVITDRWTQDPHLPPLFVSEGRTDLKSDRITASPYLGFANARLAARRREVVVFGSAFHEQDEHIWRALRGCADRVQVSVHSTLADDLAAQDEFCRMVQVQLGGCEIEFFWSTTHPLACGPALGT